MQYLSENKIHLHNFREVGLSDILNMIEKTSTAEIFKNKNSVTVTIHQKRNNSKKETTDITLKLTEKGLKKFIRVLGELQIKQAVIISFKN